MYQKIEESFIQESKLRMSQTLLVFVGVLLVAISGLYLYDWIMENTFWAISILFVSFFLIAYLFILIYLKFSKKDFSLKTFLKVYKVIDLYKNNMHEQDLKTLKMILHENNVISKDNIKEVMYHYRALLPRNASNNSAWLSVAAFAISVIALILNDTFLYSKEYVEYLKIAGILFLFILLIYAIFHMLNVYVFQMFGSVELYKRLEASITEIYINTPDEINVRKKKVSLRKHKCGHRKFKESLKWQRKKLKKR